MSYNSAEDVLYILASTHHAGRRLAFNADLDPKSYRIVTPDAAHKIQGLRGGFCVVCVGSGMNRSIRAISEMERNASMSGMVNLSHSEVLRAGHLHKQKGEELK